MFSPSQIRAGRHLAKLSQEAVATATGLSVPTIKRVESDRDVSVSADAIEAVVKALRSAGIIFVEENGEGPGVRLRKIKRGADHPEPKGSATEAVKAMEKAISAGRKKR